MATWIQLTRPAEGGTYVQFSDGKDARIYQESPSEVKRLIKASDKALQA